MAIANQSASFVGMASVPRRYSNARWSGAMSAGLGGEYATVRESGAKKVSESMATELDEFEQNMQREINAFLGPAVSKPQRERVTEDRNGGLASRARRTPAKGGSIKTGFIVKLAVRNKPLERDAVFEHQSTSISKLEAQLQAEKAARKAGFRIIGHVIDIKPL